MGGSGASCLIQFLAKLSRSLQARLLHLPSLHLSYIRDGSSMEKLYTDNLSPSNNFFIAKVLDPLTSTEGALLQLTAAGCHLDLKLPQSRVQDSHCLGIENQLL